MRPDRALSLFFFRICGVGNFKKIPILMYHSVTETITQKVHPYYCTEISPETFYCQLEILKKKGFSVVPLSELPRIQKNHDNKKYVVITFDDGYEDFFKNAYPILKTFNMPATVFIPAEMIDKGKSLDGKRLMSWDQIRECSTGSIEFGSHSLIHGKLIDMHRDQIRNELAVSKELIEKQLGTKINSFSFPYRFPEENPDFVVFLIKLLDSCGYSIAVTTIIGRVSNTDHHLLLKRLPVNEYDDEEFFMAKLAGAYDWLHSLQHLIKKARLLLKPKKNIEDNIK